ncbi:uncharacterized protein LOC122248657 [Penaeus japonicus]|uniref:uncharacterized protein LOC122248657 n=1 Tax=Penaeus japonicus TaxID=27405 RepID=UPI001C7167C0|nr:uncharacterized protein LOC122248657 [Penaeus japonicus]
MVVTRTPQPTIKLYLDGKLLRPEDEAPLTWGGAAKKHLDLLDRIQSRAIKIINGEDPGNLNNLQNLQHRRDVAGLFVMFRIQEEQVPHLQALRQPVCRIIRTTRTVERVPDTLEQPRCRTWHYHRQYIHKYIRMWNAVLSYMPRHIDYASIALIMVKPGLRKGLDIMQNEATRMILGAPG